MARVKGCGKGEGVWKGWGKGEGGTGMVVSRGKEGLGEGGGAGVKGWGRGEGGTGMVVSRMEGGAGRGGAEYAVLLLCAVYHNPLPTLLNNLQ